MFLCFAFGKKGLPQKHGNTERDLPSAKKEVSHELHRFARIVLPPAKRILPQRHRSTEENLYFFRASVANFKSPKGIKKTAVIQ
jgi:hypothetical protein